MKAITPQEAMKRKVTIIPDTVFEVFNEIISENLDKEGSTFEQEKVVERLVQKGLDREEIFAKGWLDIESAYEDAGWRVEYDKPAYNESHPATFTFKAKRRIPTHRVAT